MIFWCYIWVSKVTFSQVQKLAGTLSVIFSHGEAWFRQEKQTRNSCRRVLLQSVKVKISCHLVSHTHVHRSPPSLGQGVKVAQKIKSKLKMTGKYIYKERKCTKQSKKRSFFLCHIYDGIVKVKKSKSKKSQSQVLKKKGLERAKNERERRENFVLMILISDSFLKSWKFLYPNYTTFNVMWIPLRKILLPQLHNF